MTKVGQIVFVFFKIISERAGESVDLTILWKDLVNMSELAAIRVQTSVVYE